MLKLFVFFNDPSTTKIYTLSLHDALPILSSTTRMRIFSAMGGTHDRARISMPSATSAPSPRATPRSEEHTSELQSRPHLVCRLLLEKKKKQMKWQFAVQGNITSYSHKREF